MSQLAATPAVHPDGSPIPTAIGAIFNGGIYAGIVRGGKGQSDYHLIVLPGDAEDVTWDKAIEFAAAVGGELPTRREQRFLFVNAKDQFQDDDWYWSSEQYAPYPSNAWSQNFDYGYQSNHLKSYACRARAVRRFKI